MEYITSCFVCNSVYINDLKGFESVYLCKCNTCGLIFDKRIPTERELYEHYKIYAYTSLKPLSLQTRKSYHHLLDEFEIYRRYGNILDIGCGQGDFLVEAQKRGWNVYGTEFSQSAVSLCESRGIMMYQGELNDTIFKNISFDVITSFEVIEHINTPHKLMLIVDTKLRKEGLFYCTTPNFNALLRFFEKSQFKMIGYPEHISFYTKKSLVYLGNMYGFKVLKVLSTGIDIERLLSVFPKKKQVSSNSKVIMKKSNENIRNLTGENYFFAMIKRFINWGLTFFNKGDTVKIYWIKK